MTHCSTFSSTCDAILSRIQFLAQPTFPMHCFHVFCVYRYLLNTCHTHITYIRRAYCLLLYDKYITFITLMYGIDDGVMPIENIWQKTLWILQKILCIRGCWNRDSFGEKNNKVCSIYKFRCAIMRWCDIEILIMMRGWDDVWKIIDQQLF